MLQPLQCSRPVKAADTVQEHAESYPSAWLEGAASSSAALPSPLLQKRAWANVSLLAFVGTFINAVLITIVGR